MSVSPVRLGIVGFGAMAERGHLPMLGTLEGIAPTAVCDPTPPRRKAAEGLGLRAFKTLKEYLAQGKTEATLIAAPNKLHAPLAIECLAAGQHVIIEKPMALTLEECDKVIQAARQQKRILTVFHNRRFDPDYLMIRELLRSQRLGKIYSVDLRLNTWGSAMRFGVKEFRPQWRHEAEWGGGALYDWGVHLLDQVGQLIASPPKTVHAVLRTGRWAKDCDDLARALIEFQDATTALIEVNYLTRYPGPRWTVLAEQGTATSEAGGWDRLKVHWGDKEIEEHLPRRQGNPATIFSSFAQAIRGKGRPVISPESVRRTMRLLDACLQSVREGKSITLGM